MEIRLRDTGSVITDSEFRNLYSSTSFPPILTESIINDFGGDVVFEGAQASTSNPYEYSQRQGIEQINGKWYTKYVIGPVFVEYTDNDGITHSIEEQNNAWRMRKDSEQANAIRMSRNNSLKECDWTQIPDAPVDQAAWATYRQALRDVPQQEGFPFNVVWPTSP
jgi:Phage tail assembly chaperone protein